MNSELATEIAPGDRLPDRPDVFISYSRRDKAFVAERLAPALAERDKAVWVDVEDIPPAADWRATVLDGIAKSSAFLFVLSPDALRSEVCAEELARAVELKKRLVPVMCRAVDPREASAELARANWILLAPEDDFEAGLARVVEALETDLEWRETHTRLAVRAAEWAREGHDRAFLLRGSDLNAAEEWLTRQASHAETATAEQTDYILRSRQAATRRQRATLAAVVFALAVAVALAALALAQRRHAVRQAHVAQSRELAATSLARAGRDPELAVLLGVEANRRAATEQAEDALRRALLRWPERRVLEARGTYRATAYSPDGRGLLLAGADGVGIHDAASGRLVRSLPAPAGGVLGAGFSAGGRAVAIAGAGGATVADASTGRLLARFGAPANGAALDATGRRLLVSSATGARVFDVRGGRQISRLDDPLTAAALLDPRGEVAVTYGPRRTTTLWRTSPARRLATLHHEQPVFGAALSPDGRLLVTATLDGTATVWRVPSGRRLATLRHATPVSGASFSPDGRRLFTTGSFGRVWDVRSRRTVRTLRQDAQVLSSAFSPDGRRIVTGDIEGVARVWDVASGRQVNRLAGHGGRVDSVMFSPDGRFVITGGRDGTARIWETAPGSSAIPLGRGTVRSASLSPGRTVATADRAGAVRLYDARDGTPTMALAGPGGELTSVTFSGDGTVLAAAGERGRARIYATRDGRVLANLGGHRGGIAGVALSPDGRLAATAGEDATVRTWDAHSGRQLAALGPFGDTRATSVAFALGGRRVVAQIGQGVGLAEAPSGREVAAFGDASAVAASQDGATLAITGIGGVTLRDAAEGRETGRRAAADGIFEAAFSRDGRLLAGVSPSGGGYVWDLRRTGTLLHVRRPAVYALAVAPGNRYAAAGLLTGGVAVFELGSEQRVATFGRHGPRTDTVAFGAGDGSLLALDHGGTAWLYACDVCRALPDLVALAHERAARPLTAGERARYLHERG